MTNTLRILTLLLLTNASVSAQELLGVYVANQGNFSTNDGSITWYNLSTGQAREVLSNFGTLAQSITLYGEFGYVASNTSDAVDILRLSTNERVGQIPAIASPRYIAVVSREKAYVSQLWSSQVSVVDLPSNSVVATVSTGTNPEDIAVVGDRAFVANSGFGKDSTLTVIDTQNDAVVETLDLGCDGPRHLEVDRQGELWAFCNGNTVYNADFTEILERTNGAALVLNPEAGGVIKRIDFDFQSGASALGQDSHYSPDSEEIFLIRNDSALVVIFDTATNEYKETLTLPGPESVGGLAYDATARLLYVGRFVSFTVPGFVQILNRDNLSEAGRFDAGIAPAHLVFHRAPHTTSITSIDLPQPKSLAPAFPNPFARSTTLSFTLEESGPVSLVIYDALGREVAHPVSGKWVAGQHRIIWEAGRLPAGVYFSQLSAAGQVGTAKLVLMR